MSKYRNRKVRTADGDVFDSQKEYDRWCALRRMERAGKIRDLQRQVRFELIPKQEGERACFYTADFLYRDAAGEKVVEDCKGYRTEVYRLKRKLMLYRWKIRIKET